MLAAWRTDFGNEAIELWSVGLSSNETDINAYADYPTPDSTSACLSSTAFYFTYHPSKDDLWVVDKTGNVSFSMNLIAQPITSSTYRTLLDSAVRAALAR